MDTETGCYSFTKTLFVEYMEGDSGLLWSAKRVSELHVRLGRIGAMLNLDSTKGDEV